LKKLLWAAQRKKKKIEGRTWEVTKQEQQPPEKGGTGYARGGVEVAPWSKKKTGQNFHSLCLMSKEEPDALNNQKEKRQQGNSSKRLKTQGGKNTIGPSLSHLREKGPGKLRGKRPKPAKENSNLV